MISIDGWLERIIGIPGAQRATLVDGASGVAIAAAGQHDVLDEQEDAVVTADVVRSILTCPALVTGPGDDVTEIIVCGTRGYHLLNTVNGDFDERLFVHVLLHLDTGNLAMARHRLRGILSEFTGDGYGQ